MRKVVIFFSKVHITEATQKLVKKSYKISLTDKGTTNPKLQPYDIVTYLISPPDLPQVIIISNYRFH